MTDQQKWDEAEENMKQLEEFDTAFYGVSVDRLREIRKMPLKCYWSLSELEKHYWIKTLVRHGENENSLRKCIAILDKDKTQKRLNKQIDILVDALKKTTTDRPKKDTDKLPDIKGMKPFEKVWLSLRTTPKGKTVKYGEDIYPTQRELAEIMGVGVMKLNRLEKRMEAREDIKQYFAFHGISVRNPRGATVTKRKID